MFLSRFSNKVDKKGRVSVPASFRAALAGQDFHGVVCFPAQNQAAIDGFSWARMEELSTALDSLDQFSEEHEDFGLTVFGDAVQLPFDGEGRIILPDVLMDYAGITSQAAFVGLGKKFQIWEPGRLAEATTAARKRNRDNRRTLNIVGQNGRGGGS